MKHKWIRTSMIATSLAVAVAILTNGGLSMPSPVGAAQASSSGPASNDSVLPRLAKPIVPKVHATFTLNPKAVLINYQDVRFESAKHDIPQRLTYIGATPIGVGSIIVVSTTTGPFYGKVTAISGQLVTTVPATLGDIFEVLNLTMSTLTGSASTRQTATPLSRIDTRSRSFKAQLAVKPGEFGSGASSPPAPSSIRPLLTATCSGTISPSVTLNVTANAGTFTLQTSWSWAHGLKSATITDNPSFAVTASAAVAGSGTCTLTQPVFNVDLPPIEFLVGWVPVWITQSISGEANLDITASGSASIDIGYNATALLGAAKPHGGSWNVVHTGSATKTVNTALNVNTTSTLHLPVSYEAAIYGFGGLGVTADPFASLAVIVSPPVCKPVPWFELSAGLDGSVYAFIHFGSLYNWSQTFGTTNFFSADLINHQNVCPPITTSLNINTASNAVHTSFVPGVPSGNVIPLHSTVNFTNVGTAYKYGVVVSNPNNSGTAFNVKPGHPHHYVLSLPGNYHVTIQGGVINTNGQGTISTQLTITVP
jgi:hypothetical protein